DVCSSDLVRLVSGELGVAEDVTVVAPPRPLPGVHREFLQFPPLFVADAVEAQEIAYVAHLRPLPDVRLEPADLASSPAQLVADLVGGQTTLHPQLREPAGQPALGDGGTV